MKKKKKTALAVREAPPARVEPSGVYVKLPLPAEWLEAFQEHAANGQKLADLLSRADTSVVELGRACIEAAGALERDVTRVRAAIKSRRR